MTASAIDQRISEHLRIEFADRWQLRKLSQHYRRYGYVKLSSLVPASLKAEVRAEALRLLDLHSKRSTFTSRRPATRRAG